MALTQRKITLTDSEGKPHEYICTPFRFDQGLALKLRILKIIVKPLGDALGQVLSDAPAGAAEEHIMAEGLDLTGLGAVLAEVPERVIEAGGAALVAEILSQTVRVTRGGADGDLRLDLKDELARAKAYAGGNYVEAYQALAWVLGVNYAPFGADGRPNWSALWSGLRSFVPLITAET